MLRPLDAHVSARFAKWTLMARVVAFDNARTGTSILLGLSPAAREQVLEELPFFLEFLESIGDAEGFISLLYLCRVYFLEVLYHHRQ